MNKRLPTVYEIQRDWTGLSWETCERLQGYIEKILDKAGEETLKEVGEWIERNYGLVTVARMVELFRRGRMPE